MDGFKLGRETRGIIFDEESGQMLCRRFHKFFNVDQLEETQFDQINWNNTHIVTEKFDGCLMSPIPLLCKSGFDIRWGTKQGPTELSERVEDEFINTTASDAMKYTDFARYWLGKGYTPLFEWCSMKNHIVLTYEKDLLVLTAIRNNTTGQYVRYDEMLKSAAEFNIPITPVWQRQSNESVKDFIESIKKKKGLEGFVIRFEHDDGSMFKVKSDWYFQQSSQDKRLPNHEKELWGMILGNTIDDILPFLGEELKIRLDNFIQRLYQNIHEVGQELIAEVERHRETGVQKKDFVAKLKQLDTDPLLMPLLFKIFDKGADADVSGEIIKIILKAINLGKTQFEQARTLFTKSIKFEY